MATHILLQLGGISYFALMCVSVFINLQNSVSHKLLNQSTSFMVEAFPLT